MTVMMQLHDDEIELVMIMLDKEISDIMENRPEKQEVHTQEDIDNQIKILSKAKSLMDFHDKLKLKLKNKNRT